MDRLIDQVGPTPTAFSHASSAMRRAREGAVLIADEVAVLLAARGDRLADT